MPTQPLTWRESGAHVVVTLVWGLVLWASTRISIEDGLLGWAIAVHLFGVVVALGPIVLLDWYGLAWVAGLRRLRDCLRVAEAARPLIWLGLAVLLLSGMFLAPDLHSPMAWIKQFFVLLVLHNGVAIRPLERRLLALPLDVTNETLPRRLRLRMMGATMTSQAAWWGAFAIGCLTMAARRFLA